MGEERTGAQRSKARAEHQNFWGSRGTRPINSAKALETGGTSGLHQENYPSAPELLRSTST